MKHLVTFIGIAAILFALYSLFKAQSTAIEYQKTARQEDGACINLDKFIAENPDYTEEEIIRVEKCNKERATRLGLDKPDTGFLGNTRTHPAGALAYYESGRGKKNTFTVFDDNIEINISSGARPLKAKIPYPNIKDVGIDTMMPDTVYISYLNENNATMRYTLTLTGILRMKKSVGARDVDRLVRLIKKQMGKYQDEPQEEGEREEESAQGDGLPDNQASRPLHILFLNRQW